MTLNGAGDQSGQPGVDLVALQDWVHDANLGSGPLTDVKGIGGGTQNIMLRFSCDNRDFVLRRGPAHLRSTTNDNLRREIRLLTALGDTPVRHAKLIHACLDETILDGSVFYLMEPIDGFNAAVELPEPHASTPSIRRQMGMSVVDALAELSLVDYTAVHLGDFGRPEGFLDRQVPRWSRELDGYAHLSGYPGHSFPVEKIAGWLTRNQPTSGPSGIMHGDYHLANVMFGYGSSQVAAIVDWEMTTIGDPMLDLGWLLATWPEPDQTNDVIGSELARSGALPPAHELVRIYGERTGYDVSAADWYAVLACFKLGILLEGTYARSCAGLAPADVGARLHNTAKALFARALTLTN